MVRLISLIVLMMGLVLPIGAQKIDLSKQVKTPPTFAESVNFSADDTGPIDRGGRVYDVRAYGAVCDGVTNDVVAIQAAVTAAAGNGPVFIPQGTCAAADGLTLPDNTTIVGEGWNSVLKFTWTTSPTSKLAFLQNAGWPSTGNVNLQLFNFTLEGNSDGNPTNPATSPPHGLLVGGLNGLLVSHVKFLNINSAAMNLRGVRKATVTDNQLIGVGRGGIHFVWSPEVTLASQDVVIANNLVYHPGDDGISVFGSEATSASTVGRGHNFTITGNTIIGHNTVVSNCTGRGIIAGGVEDVVIAGNTIENTCQDGINVSADQEVATTGLNSRRVAVTGNTVKGAGSVNDGGANYGIFLGEVEDVTVENNVVTGSLVSGIRVVGSATRPTNTARIRIAGNTVSTNGGTVNDIGIDVFSGTSIVINEVQVVSNIVYNNSGAGIAIDGVDNAFTHGNLVVNNGNLQASSTDTNAAGIIARGRGTGTDMTFRNNRVYDTRGGSAKQTYGFATGASAVANLILEDNEFDGNQTGAINLAAAPTQIKNYNNRTTGSSVDVLLSGGRFTSNGLTSSAADPADAGVLRLGNAETIAWEASPAGTDVTATVNTSEEFSVSAPIVATVAGASYVTLTNTSIGNSWFFTNQASDGNFSFSTSSSGGQKLAIDKTTGDASIQGSFTIGDSGTKPTCDSTRRFMFWVDAGGAGVKDTVEVCAKDAGDAYAWRTIY